MLLLVHAGSRGLDIPGGVDHVVMFDCPTNPTDFLHRAGNNSILRRMNGPYAIQTPQSTPVLGVHFGDVTSPESPSASGRPVCWVYYISEVSLLLSGVHVGRTARAGILMLIYDRTDCIIDNI